MTEEMKEEKAGAAKPAKKSGAKKTASASAKKPAFPKMAGLKHLEMMEEMMSKGTNPFGKMPEDAAKLVKEGQEAIVESGRIYAKHMESITEFLTGLTQEAVEKNTEAFKSLWGCKTLQDLTEAQTKLAQENFDDFMANATKLSEMGIKLATEAFEPLNDQFSKTISKSMAA